MRARSRPEPHKRVLCPSPSSPFHKVMHVSHEHDHDGSSLSEMEIRVRALETLLLEKGYVDPKALDLLVEQYETKIGPRNGAKVVAKAWADPDYKARLFTDSTAAIAELGFSGR